MYDEAEYYLVKILRSAMHIYNADEDPKKVEDGLFDGLYAFRDLALDVYRSIIEKEIDRVKESVREKHIQSQGGL